MIEQEPEKRSAWASALWIAGGILVGLLAGVFVPLVVFSAVQQALAPVAPRAGMWMTEIVNLALLFVVGYVAYQKMHELPGARGLLIGISISFLLNVICGVGLLVAR